MQYTVNLIVLFKNDWHLLTAWIYVILYTCWYFLYVLNDNISCDKSLIKEKESQFVQSELEEVPIVREHHVVSVL